MMIFGEGNLYKNLARKIVNGMRLKKSVGVESKFSSQKD